MPIKAVRSVKFPALIKTTGAITLEKSGSEFTFDFDPLQCIPYDLADALPYAAGIVCNKAPKATVVTQNGFTYAFSGTNGYTTPSIFDNTQWDVIAAPGVFADTERAETAADAAEASALAAADASRLNLVSSVLTAGATPTAAISGPSGAQVLTLGLAPGAIGPVGPQGTSSPYYPGAQTLLPKGATAFTSLVGGSSGANGTFNATFSGGNFTSNPTATFVVSGGAVTTFTITSPGLCLNASPSAPTVSFAASSGLTGASVSLTVGDLVGNGATYWTEDATIAGVWRLYTRSGTSPVAGTATMASDGTLLSKGTKGRTTVGADTTWVNNYYLLPMESASDYDGWVTEVKVYGANSGTLYVGVFNTWNSSGTQYFQKVTSVSVPVSSGVATLATKLSITAGQILGFLHTGTTHRSTSATNRVYFSLTEPTTDVAGTSIAIGSSLLTNLQFQATIEGVVRGGNTLDTAFRLTYEDPLSTNIVGRSATPAAATSWTNSHWVFPPSAVAPVDGYLTDFEVWGTSAGVLNVGVYNTWLDVGTRYYQLVDSVSANVGAGLATVNLSLPVTEGQVLGFRHTGTLHYSTPGEVHLFSSTNPTTDVAGTAVTSTTISLSSQYRATIRGTTAGGAIIGGRGSSSLAVSPYAGLVHDALGTSLTALGFYTTPLAALLGTTFTNRGVSGASLGQASNGATGSLVITTTISSLTTTARVVTLECGTNDCFDAAVPLGTRGDSTTATFYGALRNAVGAILTRCSSAKIFMISNHATGTVFPSRTAYSVNSNGNYLRQYWDAMEEVCADQGVIFIDVGRKAGIGYSNVNSLTSDGLHYNTAGGTLVANYIYQEMLRAYDAGYMA
jgi:hypothetical protein